MAEASQALAAPDAEKQSGEETAARIQKEQGQKGFDKWLRSLDERTLQAAFLQTQFSNKMFDECQAYVNYVQSIQTVQICTKCRYQSGCVACSYPHALRFCLRTSRTPEWWKKSTMGVLRGMCR